MQTATPVFSTVGEEPPMTMQVGLVGSDGIVLASDTKWTHPPKDRLSSGKRYTSVGPKIEIHRAKNIAVCMAGDMQSARRIAKLIIQEWKAEDSRYPEDALERIGQQVLQQDRSGAQCHVVVGASSPQLFSFEFCELEDGWTPSIRRESGKFIAGDCANASTFWAERYCKVFQSLHLGVERLIPLAAHVVTSAASINNDGVGGLDIVICEKSSIRRLSEESISILMEKSEGWDRIIGDLFLNHRQSYNYDSTIRE